MTTSDTYACSTPSEDLGEPEFGSTFGACSYLPLFNFARPARFRPANLLKGHHALAYELQGGFCIPHVVEAHRPDRAAAGCLLGD
jgi:hypothetical protein